MVREWAKKDPILRMRLYLEGRGLWSEKQEENLQSDLLEKISTAVRKVEADPLPGIETLVEDVYAEVPWHLREQLEELKDPGDPEG